jgi:hypothetical protein
MDARVENYAGFTTIQHEFQWVLVCDWKGFEWQSNSNPS